MPKIAKKNISSTKELAISSSNSVALTTPHVIRVIKALLRDVPITISSGKGSRVILDSITQFATASPQNLKMCQSWLHQVFDQGDVSFALYTILCTGDPAEDEDACLTDSEIRLIRSSLEDHLLPKIADWQRQVDSDKEAKSKEEALQEDIGAAIHLIEQNGYKVTKLPVAKKR